MAETIASKPQGGDPWDVVIIGSGPAGLTAAIYATRGAASSLIVGGEKWGGQLMLTTLVDNYPGLSGVVGPDLMVKIREHAVSFGGEFLEKNAESVNFAVNPFEITAGGVVYKAKSVIVATGAETKWLVVPGIQELIGRGVSSCAPCDAPFFKNKKVAVVGGGDSAMEEALVLTKYASEVVLIHRREVFRASAVMQQRILAEEKLGKVSILWNTEVVQLVGSGKLEKAIVKNNKDNTQTELAIDGLFIAIGHSPSTEIFKDNLELDDRGFVKKVENEKYNMATNIPGVFVAGDVHDHEYKQAVTAAAFGCMAALEVLKYLESIKSHA